MEDPSTEDTPRVLKVLQALKQASQELQTHPISNSSKSTSAAIEALLELETEHDIILSKDRNLLTLCQKLTELKNLVESLKESRGHGLLSLFTRRASTYSISRIARSIESEIQAWIERESLDNLSRALRDPVHGEDELVKLLIQFEKRVSQGFNLEWQDLILKFKILSVLEEILCNSKCSKRIREHSAFAIAALIRFNKDVFAGQLLMGPTIRALIAMASADSIEVLYSLIRCIKSPLIDEIESNGEIPKIISFLDCKDLQMQVITMDCVIEIGYFGRKEAVEAMLREGLIKKLLQLQRSELGGDLIDSGRQSENEDRGVEEKRQSMQRYLDSHPFASCVAKFAVQLEVGEGLRQRERRAFKQEILVRVREDSISDAEAATIVAEVLWGSSP